jgi:hypothetical protein
MGGQVEVVRTTRSVCLRHGDKKMMMPPDWLEQSSPSTNDVLYH